MTIFQKLLKASYPWHMALRRSLGLGMDTSTNSKLMTPPISFYTLEATKNNGKPFSFDSLKGKYVLIVNTASNCGFTGQYAELEELYGLKKEHLEILGFPANDFGSQEPGSNSQIAEFCSLNYGVSFPLFAKGPVTGQEQQPVYNWLSQATQNGWNNQSPSWNFGKYLVDPNGTLLSFYGSSVSPLSPQIINLLT
ncbi:MAG: glutathione peroxidase [Bacteroidetes bacterium]|nr:MAG: glutathione peroxidase [Bacteroidota bacterium]